MKYLFRDNCVGVSIFRQAGAAPTITLVSIVNITDSTATANVSIADGDDVSKTGVQVDTEPTFSNPTSYEDNGAVNSIAIDNLTAETTYYVRAYVIWSGQPIYSSNSLNFTTESGSILPSELQACEWLKSDGNAAILLDYIANENTEIYCKSSDCGTINNIAMFGSRVAYMDKQFCFVINNLNKYVVLVNSEGTTQTNIGKQNNVEIYFRGNGTGTINIQTITYTTYTNKNGLKYAIFTQNQNGTLGSGFNGNIEKFNINENGVEFFKLQPCYVKSGQSYTDNKGNVCTAGTCGMYDIVNQIFYTNDGSGTFSKGADINI